MATQIIVPVSKIANVRVHPNASMLGLRAVFRPALAKAKDGAV